MINLLCNLVTWFSHQLRWPMKRIQKFPPRSASILFYSIQNSIVLVIQRRAKIPPCDFASLIQCRTFFKTFPFQIELSLILFQVFLIHLLALRICFNLFSIHPHSFMWIVWNNEQALEYFLQTSFNNWMRSIIFTKTSFLNLPHPFCWNCYHFWTRFLIEICCIVSSVTLSLPQRQCKAKKTSRRQLVSV